jgi:hypothetical protein
MSILTYLSWIDSETVTEINAHNYISKNIRPEFKKYLPREISLIIENGMNFDAIHFLNRVTSQIELELVNRNEIIDSIFSDDQKDDMVNYMTDVLDIQPWLILQTKNGGLPQNASSLVTCYFVNNHGVAYIDRDDGKNSVLVTARGYKKEWDFETDIGHEFGHASISPIPFLAQKERIRSDENNLESKMYYTIVETINIIFRGEARNTESGLAVVETIKELENFIVLCKESFSYCNFDKVDLLQSNSWKANLAISCMKALRTFTDIYTKQ